MTVETCVSAAAKVRGPSYICTDKASKIYSAQLNMCRVALLLLNACPPYRSAEGPCRGFVPQAQVA
jgi:hypothetical protein